MPSRTTEAHRALEQLEAFHASLTRPSDADLKYAIERIIGIFKANLFQALLDIQEFYDNTLLNERVPLDLKTLETKKLAERWEQHPPFGTRYTPSLAAERPTFPGTYAGTGIPYTNGVGSGGGGLADATKTTTSTTSQHSYSYHEQSRQLTKDGWQTSEYKTATMDGPGGFQTETVSNSGLIDESGKEWEVEDVVLEKNQFGLGFSIAGGKDHKTTGPYIRVTDISPGGAVARDGRIRIGDVILKVNTTDTVDVPHQVAVDALKSSGSVVRLLVKRLKPPLATAETFRSASVEPLSRLSPSGISPNSPPVPGHHQQPHVTDAIRDLEQRPGVRRMELIKMLSADGRSKGLGFSIAGGVGNQHYPGDDGIFVTRIIDGSPAYFDGRLQKGDQILAVDNVIFNGVTHQFAVNTLKNTGERVSLLYLKNPHPDLESINRQLEESDRSRSLQAFDTTGQSADLRSIGGGSHSHLAYGAQQQPPIPMEIPLEPRLVRLRKGDNGLGFNIVGGEDGEPIYVSHILPGGAAYLSGNVRTGDVLLRVNDVNLQNANHAQAAIALKAVPLYSEVQLLLQYRPLEYQVFDQKMAQVRAQMAQQEQQQYNPPTAAIVQQQQNIIPIKQDFYVRALFDNDPSRDAGVPHRALAFRYGDILHILNVNDDDWWAARKVAENGDESVEGIVPSRKRVEKRERQRRKQVNFNSGSQSLGRNASMGGGGGGFGGVGGGMEGRRGSRSQLSFSRKFPFVKSTEKLNEYGSDGAEKRYRRLREKAQQNASSPSSSKEYHQHQRSSAAAVSDSETTTVQSNHRNHSKQRHSQQFNYSPITEEPIHSYETVDLQQINYVRPVIILGALKDRINDDLVTRHPDRFSSCVPHTSRPPRENEIHGRDYYFVSKPEMDRDIKNNLFIEAGQFQNNLYGTSIASVQEVANSGRHCILDVSGNAIRRLQNTARIYPISIFVKPFSHHQLQEWDPQLNEEDALRQFERCQRQEQSFGDLFTTIVSGHSLDDIFARVMHSINEQSRREIWVPTHEPLP